MEETLGEALAALFKEAVPPPTASSAVGTTGPSSGPGPGPVGPPDKRAREALAHYDRAIERLKAGDWAGFGAELDALRPLLEALGKPPPGDH